MRPTTILQVLATWPLRRRRVPVFPPGTHTPCGCRCTGQARPVACRALPGQAQQKGVASRYITAPAFRVIRPGRQAPRPTPRPAAGNGRTVTSVAVRATQSHRTAVHANGRARARARACACRIVVVACTSWPPSLPRCACTQLLEYWVGLGSSDRLPWAPRPHLPRGPVELIRRARRPRTATAELDRPPPRAPSTGRRSAAGAPRSFLLCFLLQPKQVARFGAGQGMIARGFAGAPPRTMIAAFERSGVGVGVGAAASG